MITIPEELPARHFSIRMQCYDQVETHSIGLSGKAAFSCATHIMNGYLRKGFVVYCDLIAGRWVATRKGIPGAITLEIQSVFVN